MPRGYDCKPARAVEGDDENDGGGGGPDGDVSGDDADVPGEDANDGRGEMPCKI